MNDSFLSVNPCPLIGPATKILAENLRSKWLLSCGHLISSLLMDFVHAKTDFHMSLWVRIRRLKRTVWRRKLNKQQMLMANQTHSQALMHARVWDCLDQTEKCWCAFVRVCWKQTKTRREIAQMANKLKSIYYFNFSMKPNNKQSKSK